MSRDNPKSRIRFPTDPRESIRQIPIDVTDAEEEERRRQKETTKDTWGADYLPEESDQNFEELLSDEKAFVKLRLVDRGGVGEVWSAIQVSLERIVAVKRIREDRLIEFQEEDEKDKNRYYKSFRNEALITAQLEHPNIVPVYDLGRDENGSPLLAMKMVRGEPWSRILERDFDQLTVSAFLKKHLPIYVEMMQAVAFAHSRGIVHRDLKPSQVMLGEFGEVLLVDWGLAIVVNDSLPDGGDQPRRWIEGIEKLPNRQTAINPSGTPALMAPEQTLKTAEKIGLHTDIYALGGILYYLLTTTYPHDAETTEKSIEIASKGIVEPPEQRVSLRSVPADLGQVAMLALSPLPEDRIKDVRAMIDAVTAHLNGEVDRLKATNLLKAAEERLDQLDQFGLRLTSDDRVLVIDSEIFDLDSSYAELKDIYTILDRARVLWPDNSLLDRFKDSNATYYAMVAIHAGDLRLSKQVLHEITDREKRSLIEKKLKEAQTRRNNQTRIRRASLSAVAVLFLVLIAGAFKYINDQQQANEKLQEERDAAEVSKRNALKQQRLAVVERRKAEREQYFSTIAFAHARARERQFGNVRTLLMGGLPESEKQWEWGFLYLKTAASEMTFLETSEPASALHATYSTDGSKVYVGDRKGRLSVWDSATGNLIGMEQVHEAGVWYIMESPDGKYIVTSSFDNRGAVVDPATLEVIHYLNGHEDILRGLDISPDSKRVLTSSRDKTARVWDIESGQQLFAVPDQDTTTYDVDYSSDGKYMLTAGWRFVQVRDAETGELLRESMEHPENILATSFSPDGRYILTACTDRIARIFDAESFELIREINNQTSWLLCAEFSPDGKRLATGDNEGMCRIWDVETGELLKEYMTRPRLYSVAFHPHSNHLVTSASRGVQAWNLSQSNEVDGFYEIEPMAEHPEEHDFFHDHVFAAPLERLGAWRGYDTAFRSPENEDHCSVYQFRDKFVSIMSYYSDHSPDGRYRLRVLFPELSGVLEDTRTGEVLQEIPLDNTMVFRWSPKGDRFVSGTTTGEWHLWDAEKVEIITRLGDPSPLPKYPGSQIPGVIQFSDDGEHILNSRHDGVTYYFDSTDGQLLETINSEEGIVFSIAISKSKESIALGFQSGLIQVWDLKQQELVASLKGHQNYVLDVSFSLDGKRLASAGHDDRLKIWDLEDQRHVVDLFSLPGRDFMLAGGFTDDGMSVYAVSSFGNLYIADAIPWEPKDLPGAEGMSFQERAELYIRRKRLKEEISIEDIDWDKFTE